MAHFEPPEPPIVPDDPTPPPTLDTPLPPPEVGFGSPWAPADAENRDRILDWWRMWFRRVFFPWINAWSAYWVAQWARIVAYLNEWLNYAGEYIQEYAVAGYSWRHTTTTIDPNTPTVVLIEPYDDARPIIIGDLVSDESININYGSVTALVDNTHAEVTYLGQLRGARGLAGFGWWTTVTEIVHAGTTEVVISEGDREPQVMDLVVDTSPSAAYGSIVTVTDATHVTVQYLGTLQGPPGIAADGNFDYTTAELQPYGDAGDTYQGQMADMPQMVGAYVVTTSSRSWVRVYASEAYMIADENRDPATPLNISDDHGCYLDFVSIPTELDKTLTPGIMFSGIGSGLWLSIVNMDINTPAEISVHFDYRTFLE